MGEAKRRKAMTQTVIPRAAAMVSNSTIVQPRGVSDGSAEWLNCFNTSRQYARDHGGDIVFGFIVESGRYGPAVIFNHHAVVRVANELIDPNYKPNRAPLFLPDATRPYDYDEQINWNNIVVFTEPFQCPITKTMIPAWTLAATARINEQSAYSTDQRHFRRKHFKEGDDYQSYVQGLGLSPTSDVDLCFTTNIERVYVVLGPGETAPASIKDFHYEGAKSDLTTLTQRGLVPMSLNEIRSEAENERVGRNKRDG